MTCVSCTAPTDTALCNECTSRLVADLRSIPQVVAELDVTIQRRDVGARQPGKGASPDRSPLNLQASEVKSDLSSLLNWAAKHLGIPPTDPAAQADNLATAIRAVRKHDWAGEYATNLHQQIGLCWKACDRSEERISLGPCGNQTGDGECLAELVTGADSKTARCKTCGAVWDTRERQQWSIVSAWAHAARLPTIMRALAAKKIQVKQKDVENWIARGFILPVNPDAERKYYYMADVYRTYLKVKHGVDVTTFSPVTSEIASVA